MDFAYNDSESLTNLSTREHSVDLADDYGDFGNEQGRLQDAYKEYKRQVEKSFTCQYCWEILILDPKWQATLPNKKQKSTTDAELVFEDDINHDRPMERKAAKELLKNKGKSVVGSVSSILTPEFSNKKKKSTEKKLNDKRQRYYNINNN
ncbi:hypothetical protein AAHA92_00374 [Salvia divinorum]|uniref:No apical meristem-associated C-terminal domain-containing protein n=1 Tax=Salvia divinorum TaxID=28513 RepID=A0ABD1IJD4_SALDI